MIRAYRTEGEIHGLNGVFRFGDGPLSGIVKMIDGRICTHNTIELEPGPFCINEQLQKDVTQAVLAWLRAENGQSGG